MSESIVIALRRIKLCLENVLAGKTVRDVDEVLCEAETALKNYDQLEEHKKYCQSNSEGHTRCL